MHALEIWLAEGKRRGERRTRRALAAKVECSPAWLTEIIKGDGVPSLQLANRLSAETGIPLEKFVPEKVA